MTKQTVFTLLAALLLSIPLYSQSLRPWAIGVQGGGLITGVVGAGAEGSLAYFLPDGGLHLRWHFHPNLSVQAEANYGIRGYRQPSIHDNFASLNLVDYLSFPLMLRLEMRKGKKLRPYVGTGLFAARQFNERADLVSLGLMIGDRIFVGDEVHSYQWGFGMLHGIGARLNIDNRLSVYGELHGQWNWRDTGRSRRTHEPSRQRYLAGGLRIGLSWHLGKMPSQ